MKRSLYALAKFTIYWVAATAMSIAVIHGAAFLCGVAIGPDGRLNVMAASLVIGVFYAIIAPISEVARE